MRGAWLALSAGVVVASCDDVDVHILSGNEYFASSRCVTASAAVDVAQGPSNGDNCSPRCLVATAGKQTCVYVTSVCGPYPGDYTTEALDAAVDADDPCFGALGAYNAFEEDGSMCAPDATCSPSVESDAGEETTDAATDGSTDGGTD